jgi:hypothetical protein
MIDARTVASVIVTRKHRTRSIYPAAHDDASRGDNNGTPHNHGGMGRRRDAACPIYAGSADDGACFRCAQGDKASQQQ